MFGQAKLIFMGLIVVVLLAGYAYIQKLQLDLTVSENNNATLKTAMNQQSLAIEQLRRDIAEAQRLANEVNTVVKLQNKDVETLREKLQERKDSNGNQVTIGQLAVKSTGLMEKRINNGTNNAYRCLEIASGSPLTEQEINATKKSEINPECTAIANPNYRP